MGTLANSEDPDEMQHNAALHQLLSKKVGKDQESIQSSTTPDPGYQWENWQKQNWPSEKWKQYFLEIITCDPLNIYKGSSQVYCINQKEEPIGTQRVKRLFSVFPHHVTFVNINEDFLYVKCWRD